jgi:chemotaxis protein CheZ
MSSAESTAESPEDLLMELMSEVESLRNFIHEVRSEMAGVDPHTLLKLDIPNATENLGEVVRTTENAAVEIMDACEVLDNIGREIGGEAGDRIGNAIASIFQACSFHDLTGQRVTKVVNVIAQIEERLAGLTQKLEERGSLPELARASETPAGDLVLEGPQLPGGGLDQSAIDALLGN